MNENYFPVLCAAAGAGACSMAAFSQATAGSEVIVFCAAAGSAFGVIVGSIAVVLRARSQRAKQRTALPDDTGAPASGSQWTTQPNSRPGAKVQPASARKPFRERLATFTHQEESEVMEPITDFKSSQPFWSIAAWFSSVPPKPARLIRYYLRTVRNLVHGGRS